MVGNRGKINSRMKEAYAILIKDCRKSYEGRHNPAESPFLS